MEINGTLKNARWEMNDPPGSTRLVGNIYGDTKGRFPDGLYILTSAVLESLGDNIFRTRNSTYKVEFAESAAFAAEPAPWVFDLYARLNHAHGGVHDKDWGRAHMHLHEAIGLMQKLFPDVKNRPLVPLPPIPPAKEG